MTHNLAPVPRSFRRLWLVGAIVGLVVATTMTGVGASSTRDLPATRQRAGADAECPLDALDQATEPVEITFWHAMAGANLTTLESLVEQFNTSQDRVKVNLVFQGTYDAALTKLIASLDSEDLPTVVQLEESALQIAIDTDAMLPVQACIEADDYDTSDYLDRVLAFFTLDKTLWPMPFNVSNPVLYYNAGEFEQAGLDPDDPPTTLDELHDAAQAIVSSGAAKAGLTFDLDAWYLEQWFGKSGALLYNKDNGRRGRATQSRINSKVGRGYFDFFERMRDDGLLLESGTNSTQAFTAFATGEAAMVISSSAAMGSIFDAIDSGQFPATTKVAVGELPAIPGNGGSPVGGGSLWLVREGSSPEQIAAAWELMKFLDEPAQQAAWHIGTGYIPIRESAAALPDVTAAWEQRPQYRVPFDQLLEGKTNAASAGAVVGPFQELRDVYRDAWEKLLVDDADAKSVLSEASSKANSVIEDYNRRIGG